MSALLPPDSLPADMTMLLKLIDAKFETQGAKLDGISIQLGAIDAKLNAHDRRMDDHEHRIADIEGSMKARELQVKDFEELKVTVKAHGNSIVGLEKWQTEEQTTSRNATKWGGVVWSLCGSGVTALLMFTATAFFQSRPAAHEPAKTTEITKSEITAKSTIPPVH